MKIMKKKKNEIKTNINVNKLTKLYFAIPRPTDAKKCKF